MNKKYTLYFKKSACELLEKFDNSPSRVANDLNIPIKTYEKWIQSWRKNPYVFDEEKVSFEIENKKLRRKIKEQEETITLLKKTYAFFTQGQP